MFDLLRFNVARHWLVGLQVLYFHSIAIDFHSMQRVFNSVNIRHYASGQTWANICCSSGHASQV